MSHTKDLLGEIMDLLARGDLSFVEIAERLEVPISWVWEAADIESGYYGEDM